MFLLGNRFEFPLAGIIAIVLPTYLLIMY